MKKNYFLIVLIAGLLSPFMMQAQRQAFFTESMGEGASSPYPTILEWTGWHNPDLTITDGGSNDLPVVSAGAASVGAAIPFYPEGSRGNNILFNPGSEKGFVMSGIDASAFKNIQLAFGYRKDAQETKSVLDVYYSIGTDWVKLDYDFLEETDPVSWYRSPAINLPEEAQVNNLALRFVLPESATTSIRIDDVWLTGEPKLIAAPVINEATDVGATEFTASWDAYTNATGYLLDVSENADFTKATETTTLAAWTFPEEYVAGTVANPDIFTPNNKDQAISFTTTGNAANPVPYTGGDGTVEFPWAYVATGWDDGVYKKHFQIDVNTTNFTELTLSSKWYSSGNGPRTMKVQYRLNDSHVWVDVPNSDYHMPVAAYDETSELTDLPLPSACENQENVSIRWTMTGSMRTNHASAWIVTSGGTGRIRDIFVKGMEEDVLSGYQSVAVTSTSHTVIGLEAEKTYYYRVRATDDTYVSNASDVKEVTTKLDVGIESQLNQQGVQVYYNSSTDCFDVKGAENATNLSVRVSDISGRTLKLIKSVGSERSIKANDLPSGVYIVTLSVDGKNLSQKCIK